MTDNTPPLSGIARKTRVDKGISRKSNMDQFADTFRRMTASEQSTALEVLRQIQRLKLPIEREETTGE
jgi:hypothetical protein